MVAVVLIINLIISLICLYVAGKIWRYRQILAKVADKVNAADRGTYRVLHSAPNAIIKGQKGTRSLRQKYQQLEIQIQQLQKIMVILRLGQKIWVRSKDQR